LIYIERTINIEDNSAYIEEPVILYKGDGNIEVKFTINNNPFKYKAGIDQTFGQLIIKRPTTDPIFSNVAKLSSKLSSDKETSISIVHLVITGEMIDELVELGNYDFQIRLLNTDMSSRATLPPVTAGILIKEPICEESVNSAPVNYSRAAINREIVDTFDEEGNYNKTDWSNGDIITDKKLNKIEDALYEINDNSAAKEDIPVAVSQLENDADYATKDDIPTDVSAFTNDAGYLTEHQSLEDYALKTDIPSTDGLATEQYVGEFIDSLDVSYFPNSIGYVTEAYVDDAVANVDLTDYATKEELPIVPTDISAFTNDIGYINDISHLASREELPTNVSELVNDMGYITEHQDVSYLATRDELQRALDDIYAILEKLNRKVEVVYNESAENLSLSPEPEVIEEQLVIDEETLTYDSIEENLNIN
jgi:hypothetical protein